MSDAPPGYVELDSWLQANVRHVTARRSRTSSTRHAPGRGTTARLSDLPTGPFPTSMATAELVRREDGILLLLDQTESSWIDLRDPAHLDFEYQQQMNAVLDVLVPAPAAVRAVHLGGAACALARAWEARRPGSTQMAVEIDELLARSVRQWCDLPRSPRLRIRVGDAAQVAPTLRPGEWDVVVRDVFTSGQVPPSCATLAFHEACRNALAPGGIYLVNLPSLPRAEAGVELQRLEQAVGHVLVIGDPAYVRGKRRGNLVAIARVDPWTRQDHDLIERAVRRLPLPVRTWRSDDPALPHAPHVKSSSASAPPARVCG